MVFLILSGIQPGQLAHLATLRPNVPHRRSPAVIPPGIDLARAFGPLGPPGPVPPTRERYPRRPGHLSPSAAALKDGAEPPRVGQLAGQELALGPVRPQVDELAARGARLVAGHQHREGVP